MSATKTLLTAEEFDNYPFEEDKRYELDEGELIEMTRPAYKHNRVMKKLLVELEIYLRKNPLGEVLVSENLYALSANTRRSPDVAVILGDRHEELKDAKVIPIIPEIAAEVLSPSETPRTIHRKLKQYFAAGVKEVWLIDPDSREVEVWTGPALPARALAVGEALTSPLLPGFGLPLGGPVRVKRAPLNAEKRKDLARLAKMPGRRIDLSDIPDIKKLPSDALMGGFSKSQGSKLEARKLDDQI